MNAVLGRRLPRTRVRRLGTGAQRGASEGGGVWPQAGQTQRWPRSALGMRSSTVAGIRVCMHQQVSGGSPAATAQALAWPHKGQVAGEGAADMAPVYAVFRCHRVGRGSSSVRAVRTASGPIAGAAATWLAWPGFFMLDSCWSLSMQGERLIGLKFFLPRWHATGAKGTRCVPVRISRISFRNPRSAQTPSSR